MVYALQQKYGRILAILLVSILLTAQLLTGTAYASSDPAEGSGGTNATEGVPVFQGIKGYITNWGDNAPLEGAEIRAYSGWKDGAYSDTTDLIAISNGQGQYSLPLAVGKYKLEVGKPGLSIETRTDITVEPEQIVHAHFSLQESDGSFRGIKGSVTESSADEPNPLNKVYLKGVTVSAYLVENGQMSEAPAVEPVYTDTYGKFAIPLSPGKYKLVYEKDGYPKTTGWEMEIGESSQYTVTQDLQPSSGGTTGGEPTDETGGEPTGDTGGETTGETGGETSGETGGETSGETGGETTGETGGEPTGGTGGEPTDETGGEPTGDTGGETTGGTGGETTDETGGEPTGETDGGYEEPEYAVTGSVYLRDGVTTIKNAHLQYVKLDSAGLPTGYNIGQYIHEDGIFQFNPEGPGLYQFLEIEFQDLDGYYKTVPLQQVFELTADLKLVQNGQTVDFLRVTLPEPNVQIAALEKNSPLANTALEVQHLDEPYEYGGYRTSYVKTGLDGQAFEYLKPGQYKIVRVSHPYYMEVDIPFTVADSGLTYVPVILYADANVNVQILKDGLPVVPSDDTSYGLSVYNTSDYTSYYRNTVSGSVFFELPPGKYSISGVSVNTNKGPDDYQYDWFEIKQEFEVTSLHTASQMLTVPVLLKDPNVTGTLKDESGNLLENAWIQFRSADNQYYGAGTKSGTDIGKFKLWLNPGSYVAEGYSYYNRTTESYEYVQLSQFFTVEENVPLNLDLQAPKPNLRGTLYNAQAEAWADADLIFEPRNLTDEQRNHSWQYEIRAHTNKQGQYKLVLPDGEYALKAVSVNNPSWQWIDMGGLYKIDIVNGVPANPVHFTVVDTEFGKEYNIVPLPPTLQGIVFKKDGVTAWADAQLIFEPRNLTEEERKNAWKYEKHTRADSQGRYQIALTDGQYRLKAIASDYKWTEMGSDFITFDVVQNGQVANAQGFVLSNGEYNIVPLADNVKGVAVDFNGAPILAGKGNPVERGWVNIQEKFDWSNFDWSTATPDQYPKYYYTEVNPDGSFSLNIDKPGEYFIQSFGFDTVDTDGVRKWESMQLDFPFTVSETGVTDLGTVGPNLKGTAQVDGQKVANGGVIIRPQNLTAEQAKEAWKLDKWVPTDADGKFITYIKPGDYEIYAVSGPGYWMEVGYKFSIPASGSVTLDSIEVVTNVVGTVKNKEGLPLEEAYVSIRKGTWPNEEYFGAQADKNGFFRKNLADGDYTIRGLSYKDTEGTYKYISLSYRFKVVGGFMQTADDQALASIDLRPNVTGTVKKSLEDLAGLADGWLTVKPAADDDSTWENTLWLQASSTGAFEAYLAPGQYKVIDIGANDGTSHFWKRIDVSFDVDADGNLAAVEGFEGHVQDGRLIAAGPKPNFLGEVYGRDGSPLKDAWIMIRPKDASYDEYEKNQWFSTDANGQFSGKLKDGDYVVANVSHPNEWMELNVEFSISSGIMSGPTVQNGKLIIKPNVTGTAYASYTDAFNNTPLGNGWITFKPATAAEHEWSKARWAQTDADGKFALYLPAGESWIAAYAGNGTAWIEPRQTFTVDANGTELEVKPPVPNVTGTVYTGQTGDERNASGWFSVVRVAYDPNTESYRVLERNGHEPSQPVMLTDRNNVWQYTSWFNTDAEGGFSINLDAGTAEAPALYYVLYVGGPNTWYEPGTVFQVAAGQPADVSIRPAADNVTGTVSGLDQVELNKDYSQYWMKVVDANDPSEYKRHWWIPVKDDQNDSTSGTGRFSTMLSVGSYVIEGIATPNGFLKLEETQVAGGLKINIGNMSLQVTRDINLGTLKRITGQVTANGVPVTQTVTLKIIERMTDANGTVDTPISIQTDADGRFSLILKEGTEAQAYSYWIEKAAMDVWVNVTVTDGTNLVNEGNPITEAFDTAQPLTVSLE